MNVQHPLMCLTYEACPLAPEEQCRQLAQAGARLLQVRLKELSDARYLEVARRCVEAAHAHGATCLLNDRAHLVEATGADGVHLGAEDMPWLEARRLLGPNRIIGGTVNVEASARLAGECGCLDYVGIGPFRFTGTKKKLAPVLGPKGIAALLPWLRGLPVWVIGGISSDDLPAIQRLGVNGVAVCSALFEHNHIQAKVQSFLKAWPQPSSP